MARLIRRKSKLTPAQRAAKERARCLELAAEMAERGELDELERSVGAFISPGRLRTRLEQLAAEVERTQARVAATPNIPPQVLADWQAWLDNVGMWLDENTDSAWSEFWAGTTMDEAEEYQRQLVAWRGRLVAQGAVLPESDIAPLEPPSSFLGLGGEASWVPLVLLGGAVVLFLRRRG